MGKIKYQLISICFLVLAIGFQSIAVENKNFLDVEEEKWYYEEVYAAVNYGLILHPIHYELFSICIINLLFRKVYFLKHIHIFI